MSDAIPELTPTMRRLLLELLEKEPSYRNGAIRMPLTTGRALVRRGLVRRSIGIPGDRRGYARFRFTAEGREVARALPAD